MTTGDSGAISAQHASTRAMSRSIGFSHNTALPARTAATTRSTWVLVGDPMITASTPSSASTVATSAVACAPCRAASSFAGPSIGSHTQASSARGFAVTDSACTVPIRPQPNRAIRVMA